MIAALAAVAAVAVAAAAPGVTPADIALGATDGAAAQGAAAYFAYVNDRGGVDGRTISLQLDATPDVVFASLAAAPLEGAPVVGAVLPSAGAEAEAFGRYLAANLPTARLAVLHDPLDDGLAGLRRGLGVHRSLIAAAAPVDVTTDLTTALSDLKGSGAIVLCVLTAADDALAALAGLGWKPRLLVRGATRPPAGTIAATTLKDPGSARWAADPGIALYRRILVRYARGADPRDPALLAGMASAFTAVDVLRRSGRAPTRAGAARAAAGLVEANNPFLLPGATLRPGSQRLQLQRWTKGRWELLPGLIAVRA